MIEETIVLESTAVNNEARLEALRQSHGHLSEDEFFALAMNLNIALPPNPAKDPEIPSIPAAS